MVRGAGRRGPWQGLVELYPDDETAADAATAHERRKSAARLLTEARGAEEKGLAALKRLLEILSEAE